MYQCAYSREPVNFRLLALRILKKFWVIPAFIIGGAAIVLGIYFFYKTVITGRTYQVQNIYYIDFAEDSSGAQYTWVNQYTWSELSDMNVFIDGIYEDLGGAVSKEELRAASDCTVEADGRYLYMRITTKDPVLSQKVANSYEKTLFAFCDEHKEFNNIVCEHHGEVKEHSNIRVKEVCIIGAVMGLILLLAIALVRDVTDTSVYIPATVEYRYHIPTLGAPSMEEFATNVDHFLKGKKRIAVINLDQGEKGAEYVGENAVDLLNPIFDSKVYDQISDFDAVVVSIKAGAHNGKQFERLIEELSRLDVNIDAVMLTKEDTKLIKRYYRG